ncbi:hypothetical protein [Candidatus Leptofilum sp.]|uniref:hypothetical protein n=1 Tax=Candidatus Leptofilum sp. TaxID=3241576 RepID=UPI003B5B441B
MNNLNFKMLANLIRARRNISPYALLLGSSLNLNSSIIESVIGTRDWEQFYSVVHELSSDERFSLLSPSLENLDLAAGYKSLAKLIKEGYFNPIFAATLDSGLLTGLAHVGLTENDREVLVNGRDRTEQIVAAIKRPRPTVKILFLRGSLQSRIIPLTYEETFEFDAQIASILEDYLNRDILVIGTGSRDVDIHRCFHNKGGSIWLISPQNPSSDDYLYRLQSIRKKGGIISGEEAEFNKFFLSLEALLKSRDTGNEKGKSLSKSKPDKLPYKESRLRIDTRVLYNHLPTSVLHLYNPESMPLIQYRVRNNSEENILCMFHSEIENYSFSRNDSVNVLPGEETIFNQLPKLDSEKISSITEIKSAQLHSVVEYIKDEKRYLYHKQDYDIYLLARNVVRWAVPDSKENNKFHSLIEHIAAWVTPRNENVKQMLRSAADYIASSSIWGYQGNQNPELIRNQVKAIFNALKLVGEIAYINSPFAIGPSDGEVRQAVRLPRESLSERSANCIDGAVLYASLLELAALEPVIVLLTGHAFVGWKTWKGKKEYEFLETTMTLTDSFENAYRKGMNEYQTIVKNGWFNRPIFHPHGFARLLDIKALHDKGIYPME